MYNNHGGKHLRIGEHLTNLSFFSIIAAVAMAIIIYLGGDPAALYTDYINRICFEVLFFGGLCGFFIGLGLDAVYLFRVKIKPKSISDTQSGS